MKVYLKIACYLLTVAILVLILLTSTVAYLYYHPERTKTLLLEALTKSLNCKIEAKEFLFRLHPVRLDVKGLRVLRKEKPAKPLVTVNQLKAEAIEYPEKKWNIWQYKYLKISGVKVDLSDKSLENLLKPPSTPSSFLSKYVSSWFLRNLKKRFSIKEISLSDCSGSINSKELSLRFKGFRTYFGETGLTKLGPFNFSLDFLQVISGHKNNSKCVIEDLTGSGTISFSKKAFRLTGKLRSDNLKVITDSFSFENASFFMNVTYLPSVIKVSKLNFSTSRKTPVLLKMAANERIWGQVVSSFGFNIKKKLMTELDLEASFMDMFNLKASGSPSHDEPGKLLIEAKTSPIPVEQLFVRYKNRIPMKFRDLTFLGPWHPRLSSHIEVVSGKVRPNLSCSIKTTKKRVKVRYKGTIVECEPGIHVQAFLNRKGFSVNGELSFQDSLLDFPGDKTVIWNFETFFDFHDGLLSLSNLVLSADSPKSRLLPPLKLKAAIALNLNRARIEKFEGSLQGEETGQITFAAGGGWKEKESIRCVVNWEKHDLGKLLKFYDLLPVPLEITSSDKLEVVFFRKTSDLTVAKVTWNTRVQSLSDPDYTYGGEKISINGKVIFENGTRGLSLRGKIWIPTGELLANVYYIDFLNNPFSWDFSATYQADRSRIRITRSRIRLAKILTIDTPSVISSGKNKPVFFSVKLKIPRTPVTPLFVFFVKEPYKDETPTLEKVITGGSVSLSTLVRGTIRNLLVKGHLLLSNTSFKMKDRKVGLFVFDGSIPIWLEPFKTGKSPNSREKPITGDLKISLFSVPFLGNYSSKNSVYALPNLLRLNNHTMVKNDIFDLDVKPVVIRYVPPRGVEIETGMQISQVDIGKILSRLEFLQGKVKGQIFGNLRKIKIVDNNLKADGVLSGKIFDGTIKISNITVENVFKGNRVIGMDIDFTDINLEKLTAITNFGRITGVLEGYVHDLKIAYGQPLSFDALFKTVKKKGIPQKINVKAVENIAQLGGSGSSFQGLGKLVTMFFKEFPYEQIGIRCRLKNDVFNIRGTVISDHTEYLVKRKGFTGINVINRNPENNISFHDMVKRLQRITKTSQPVINP